MNKVCVVHIRYGNINFQKLKIFMRLLHTFSMDCQEIQRNTSNIL